MPKLPKSIGFASALTAAVAAAGVPAQAASAYPAGGISKSEAILGGPSQLAQILAQQGARPAAPIAAAPQPASYSLPPITSAVLRTTDGVIDGMPDVFGSVALKVGHTPLDWRWRSVEDSPVTGAPAAYARSLRELDPAEKAALINQYVNRRVRYTEDIVQYGKADYWARADETLRHGRGDCEDYAIAKYVALRMAGVAAEDLRIVVMVDTFRHEGHAVTAARLDGRWLILDNRRTAMIEDSYLRNYRPLFVIDDDGVNRFTDAPVLASMREPAPATPTSTLNVQPGLIAAAD